MANFIGNFDGMMRDFNESLDSNEVNNINENNPNIISEESYEFFRKETFHFFKMSYFLIINLIFLILSLVIKFQMENIHCSKFSNSAIVFSIVGSIILTLFSINLLILGFMNNDAKKNSVSYISFFNFIFFFANFILCSILYYNVKNECSEFKTFQCISILIGLFFVACILIQVIICLIYTLSYCIIRIFNYSSLNYDD